MTSTLSAQIGGAFARPLHEAFTNNSAPSAVRCAHFRQDATDDQQVGSVDAHVYADPQWIVPPQR